MSLHCFNTFLFFFWKEQEGGKAPILNNILKAKNRKQSTTGYRGDYKEIKENSGNKERKKKERPQRREPGQEKKLKRI